MESLVIISASILCTYIFVSILNFGIPKSLSETYYLYEFGRGFGGIFSICFGIAVAILLPAWIQMSEGSPFQFLGFLAPSSLLFVAVAPRFKEDFEGKVHSVSAIFAAICALLWVILVAKDYISLVIGFGAMAVLGLIIKSLRKNLVFSLEMISFVSTYLAIAFYLTK